jgi:hypothetical protein
MTFDTFDSYNTDEAYKDKGTTAKGLVDAYKKDNPNGSADDFYAKLNKTWAQDKDGHVKNAVNEAFKTKEEVKEEPKAETPKVEEMTQTTEALEQPKAEQKEEKTPYTSPLETEETGIKQSDKNYMNEVNAILNEEQKKELQKLAKTSADDYNRTMENMERSGDAFKKIDDKLIEQLPTFMFKRYQQGEFGDPKSSDAKLRLAYFAMNNVVSKLKKLYNADSIVRGQGPIFSDTESAYDQYQKTNLEQGLENRWNKYKAETDSAIKMVQDRNVSEEDALNIINKISMNNRLQNAFNMADANKKAYMIEVLSKVGDKVSNWNDQKFINALVGAEMTGEDVGNAAALIGARAGEKILDNFNLFDENGNLDLSALKTAMNIPGFTDKFKTQFGFDPNNLLEGGNNSSGGESSEGEESATGVKLSDGTIIDVGKMMSLNDFSGINKAATKLSNRYYRGEISEEQFRSDYSKLYNVVQSHNIMNKLTGTLKPVDKRVKELDGERVGYWDRQIEDLNNQAKNGLIKPSDYNEKFAEYEKSLVSAGGDAKKTAKKKMSTEAIIKANEKINKEKKKRR